MIRLVLSLAAAAVWCCVTGAAMAAGLCQGFGPQSPRDISDPRGTNARRFTLAPPAAAMNLCNIHLHVNAEHRGPGFSVPARPGARGGYQCNDSGTLTAAELDDPTHGQGAFQGIRPGDTIEVHWVHTSCEVAPGAGLGACLSEACSNPELRVEAQVFLLVNDPAAPSFQSFGYDGARVNGLHQARALPGGTGTPVVFAGSTTGPGYTESLCSPLQVTWSVRPDCARLDISSLHLWAAGGNVFKEEHAHGVRPLVTAPDLLSRIE